jgi:hypothetical protein
MKKSILMLGVALVVLASCSSEPKVAECDANNAESAAKCICDLYNQLDNSGELSDEDYNKLSDRTSEFDRQIDEALNAEKYTYDDLRAAAEKIGCNL